MSRPLEAEVEASESSVDASKGLCRGLGGEPPLWAKHAAKMLAYSWNSKPEWIRYVIKLFELP